MRQIFFTLSLTVISNLLIKNLDNCSELCSDKYTKEYVAI